MINDQSIENIIVIRTEYHFCRRPNANYVCLYLNGQIKKSMSFNLLVTSITLSVGLLAHRAPGERHHEKSWIWNRWKNGKLYLQIDSGCSAWSRGCATRKSSSQPWEVANRPQPSNGTFYIYLSNRIFCKLLSDSHWALTWRLWTQSATVRTDPGRCAVREVSAGGMFSLQHYTSAPSIVS